MIVKPSIEDASMGIDLCSVVGNLEDLFNRVAYIIEEYEQPAMVEQFIAGRELAVAMWGNEIVEILPIAEDDFSAIPDPLQHVLTYESKWKPESPYFQNIPPRIPASLTPKEEQAVRKVAENTFRAVGLRDLGRVDIRFDNGIPYVIDINELPDLSPDAGFWNSVRATGLTYPQMVERILIMLLNGKDGSIMIVYASGEDGPQIHAINANTSVFSQEEVECVDELWGEYQAQGAENSGYYFIVDKEDGQVLGYACYGPRALTDRTYDLYWIAVDPNARRGGVGARFAGCHRGGCPQPGWPAIDRGDLRPAKIRADARLLPCHRVYP